MVSVIALILVLLPSLAHATRYWVSTTGSDANACASVDGDEDPGVYKATVASGIACLTSAGDRLTVKAGTYTGSGAVIKNLPTAGTAGNPIIIEGDPSSVDGCAISSTCPTLLQPSGASSGSLITKSYVTVRKFRIDHQNMKQFAVLGMEIASPSSITGITFEDIEAYGTRLINTTTACGAGGGFGATPAVNHGTFRRVHAHDLGNFDPANFCSHGLYVQGDDMLVEDSVSHDNANTGMQCYNSNSTSDGRPDRCTVRRSKFYNNGAAGLVMEGHDAKVYHNQIYGNGAGILLGYTGALRAHVYGNTIYNNSGSGIQFRSTADDSEAINNIIFGNDLAIEIPADSGGSTATGIVQTYNACSSAQSCGSTGKLTIAALTDILVSTSDFRLKASSSAINAGTSVTDYTCNGTCDIGAFEAVPTPTGTITANVATLSFPIQNGDVPVNIPSATGVSVSCTGHASCPGAPTISTAVRRTGTDTLVDVTILGITGNACAATQTWTISYSRTTGAWTDNAKRGYTDNQPIDSFTNLSLANSCTGAGPTGYPAGYHIYYKFDEGTGTNANDESANNLDCTLTNSATWGTGKTGTGVAVASGTSQYCAVAWGSGVNPSTQSLTIFMPVKIATGETANLHYLGGPTLGSGQRFYICGRDGTWRLAVQGTTCSATTPSNLTVDENWNKLTIRVDSSTDIATLYKDTTAGTGGATASFTSFTFASDFRIGKLDTNNTTGNYVFDDFLVYLSLQNPADLVAAFEIPATSPGGSLIQAAIQYQGVVLDTSGNPIVLGSTAQTIEVPADGGVVLLFQIYCDNIADCDATAFKLVYDKNGALVWQQVPDAETSDGTWMWGSSVALHLNTGARSTRLTGSCALTTGTTQVTASQTPSVDLPQDGCVVQAYVVRVGATHVGDYFDYKMQRESGVEFTAYTQIARVRVVNPMASGVGF
jgi:hypothetical protein